MSSEFVISPARYDTLGMQIEKYGNITIITPNAKQIDVMNSDDFGAQLLDAIKGSADCVLDLRNVLFIDSSGLGRIISALRTFNDSRHKLVICGMTDAVALLFRMVQLAQIATLSANRDEALSLLGTVS